MDVKNKKIIITNFLALSVFMITGCADSNLSKHENKGDDIIQNNGSDVDSANTQTSSDNNGNDDSSDYITGTQTFIEKQFLNLDEVTAFYINMNSENNSSFIIPDYSY